MISSVIPDPRSHLEMRQSGLTWIFNRITWNKRRQRKKLLLLLKSEYRIVSFTLLCLTNQSPVIKRSYPNSVSKAKIITFSFLTANSITKVFYIISTRISVYLFKVLKLTLNCVHDLLDCCKLFIRWMNGTCLLTPPQKSHIDGESDVIFSFYSDIVNNRNILNIIKEIADNMKESLSEALRCVMHWKKFQMLWKDDKEAVVAKWASKSPAQLDKFSQKFHAYRYLCLVWVDFLLLVAMRSFG